MSDDTLETLVNQLESLDGERRRVAQAAFRRLAETDRELYEMAIETFDGETTAARWFSEPVTSLGEEIPLVLLLKGKREDVVYILGVIRHGLFA